MSTDLNCLYCGTPIHPDSQKIVTFTEGGGQGPDRIAHSNHLNCIASLRLRIEALEKPGPTAKEVIVDAWIEALQKADFLDKYADPDKPKTLAEIFSQDDAEDIIRQLEYPKEHNDDNNGGTGTTDR